MSSNQHSMLVGDIGGTNARFAVLDQQRRPLNARTYTAADYPSLGTALQQFLQDESLQAPQQAAIAVATRVLDDTIAFTNNEKWSFSRQALASELGIGELHVVNDFTALALSVPHLPAESLRKVGAGEVVPGQPIGVVGPGTGFGVSGLIPLPEIGGYKALNSEGGHSSASPSTQRELAVLSVFLDRFGHVSFERFLSGPGLVNVYQALCEIDGVKQVVTEPAQVTELGLNGSNAQCVETLHLFCGLLGSYAGDLALTLGASGGIFIGGGIVPRLGDFFAQSGFRQRFESKGRVSDELAPVPTFVIHDPYPGLLGAATLLNT